MLESDQSPTQGVMFVLNKSSISNDLRHTFGCAFATRGGVCDCGARPATDWRVALDPDLIHDHVGEEDLP